MRRLSLLLPALALALSSGGCSPDRAAGRAERMVAAEVPVPRSDDARHPVAGRDEPATARQRSLESMTAALRDQLGAGWRIEPHVDAVVAVRRGGKATPHGAAHRVAEEQRAVRRISPRVETLYGNRELLLRGRVERCEDAAVVTQRFAHIEGVDRILVEFACPDGRERGSRREHRD